MLPLDLSIPHTEPCFKKYSRLTALPRRVAVNERRGGCVEKPGDNHTEQRWLAGGQELTVPRRLSFWKCLDTINDVFTRLFLYIFLRITVM
jgi:hypothetical protein